MEQQQDQTLLAICGDKRLWFREQELTYILTRLDGTTPYRAVWPGGCLPYQNDQVMEAGILPFLHAGANHIYIEDHMGDNADVGGCQAYKLKNRAQRGSHAPYPHRVEEQDHITHLESFAKQASNFAERHGYAVTVSTGLYKHDAAGFGSVTLQQVERPELIDAHRSISVHHLVARR